MYRIFILCDWYNHTLLVNWQYMKKLAVVYLTLTLKCTFISSDLYFIRGRCDFLLQKKKCLKSNYNLGNRKCNQFDCSGVAWEPIRYQLRRITTDSSLPAAEDLIYYYAARQNATNKMFFEPKIERRKSVHRVLLF